MIDCFFKSTASVLEEQHRTGTGLRSWGGAIEYTYDKVGNITSQHLPGETKNYSYNTINQLTQVSGFTPLTFSYDIYGNVADNGRHHFIYNDAGQLISADDGQYDKVYLYDAMGKRVQVIDHDGNTEYEVYDESDRLLLVEESDGSLKRKIYLGNKLIAHNRSGEVKYLHFDTLGSTIAVSDADGILDLEHYQPYGDKVEWPLGTDNEQWYTGKRFDWDISLSYHGARYYDPAIGRFYANDPVDYLGHLNSGNPVHGFGRYTYANNNPYKYTDPDGEFAIVAAVPWAYTAIKSALFVGSATAVAYVASEALNTYNESSEGGDSSSETGRETKGQGQAEVGDCPRCGGDTSNKPSKIGKEHGMKPKEVKEKIHEIKNGQLTGNPDVEVCNDCGEVFPQTEEGGLGDSIGNIQDDY